MPNPALLVTQVLKGSSLVNLCPLNCTWCAGPGVVSGAGTPGDHTTKNPQAMLMSLNALIDHYASLGRQLHAACL